MSRHSLQAFAGFISLLGWALLAWAATAEETPTAPDRALLPLAGNDLGDFTIWLKETKTEDPKGVFKLENGVLRAGDEDMGYVATRRAYRDYHLSLEYRWGRKNPNDKYVRNSGLLIHGIGPDGSSRGVWRTCIECQLAQGCEGDLIVIAGKTAEGAGYPATITCDTRLAEDGKTRWEAGGKPVKHSGRQFWWSKHEPFFKELSDTRGKRDLASPLGEWTRVEAICAGRKVTIKINGETVNECYDANPAAGKIMLQAEGHEVFFRNLEIRPLAAK